jgi:plasmid stabilization system protein ParE
MYKVRITEPAELDIKNAHNWWRDNRSAEQAARWYRGNRKSIKSLRSMPERHAQAAESDSLPQGVRQSLFGLGRHPTHRIVFTITTKEVIVLRVRHTSQEPLQAEELQ